MCLWIIGEYVLDIIIELNLEDHYANSPDLQKLLWLEGDSLKVDNRLRIEVDIQGHILSFPLNIKNVSRSISKITLQAGRKYNLEHGNDESQKTSESLALRTMAQKTVWGGGGYNLVISARSLSPVEKTPNLKFTAISHEWQLNIPILKTYLNDLVGAIQINDTTNIPQPEHLLLSEPQIAKLSGLLRRFSAEYNVIEWALARENIDFAFCRDGILEPVSGMVAQSPPMPQTNLIISEISTGKVVIKDRIILKGPPPKLFNSSRPDQSGENTGRIESPDKWIDKTKMFVKQELKDGTFLMLNSLRDRVFVESLFQEWHSNLKKNLKSSGLIAMTETNCVHIDCLFKRTDIWRPIQEFSMIFNEEELASCLLSLFEYAKKEGDEESKLREWLDYTIRRHSIDFPKISEVNTCNARSIREIVIAQLNPVSRGSVDLAKAIELLDILRTGVGIRGNLYLTLGALGSLCFDRNNSIWYTQACSGIDRGFDTTGLGDAWAAAITLLEYHSTRASLTPEKYHSFWGEMESKHFLEVANAVAYCKLTNQFGRIFLPQLKRVMRNNYIPVTKVYSLSSSRPKPILLTPTQIAEIHANRSPITAERIDKELLEALRNIFAA